MESFQAASFQCDEKRCIHNRDETCMAHRVVFSLDDTGKAICMTRCEKREKEEIKEEYAAEAADIRADRSRIVCGAAQCAYNDGTHCLAEWVQVKKDSVCCGSFFMCDEK